MEILSTILILDVISIAAYFIVKWIIKAVLKELGY